MTRISLRVIKLQMKQVAEEWSVTVHFIVALLL